MNSIPRRAAAAPPRHRPVRAARCLLGLSLAVAATASVAGPCNISPLNTQFVEKASPGIYTPAFIDYMATNMAFSNVKGYVLTLTNREGDTVARITQGLARTSCDPGGQRNFTASTETPWGSVSKLITTAAAIKVASSFGADLDSSIVNFLPYRWRSHVHPRFAVGEDGSGPVTLRMMLQHRGGFRHSSCGGRDIKTRLIDGDSAACTSGDPPAVGTRSYSNMLGIFQILMAYMYSPQLMQTFELNAAGYNTADYDAYLQMVTNNSYRGLVNSQLFAPIGITGSCNMAELVAANPTGNYIRWYDNASDTSGTLPPDQNHTCASGAWILSSTEMSSLLYQLKHTSNVLSPEDYALMEAGSSDSLGWWRSDWTMGTSYSHNGQWGGTRAEVRSLPGGFIATLVMNSANFAGSLLNAGFKQARVVGIAHAVSATHLPNGVL